MESELIDNVIPTIEKKNYCLIFSLKKKYIKTGYLMIIFYCLTKLIIIYLTITLSLETIKYLLF